MKSSRTLEGKAFEEKTFFHGVGSKVEKSKAVRAFVHLSTYVLPQRLIEVLEVVKVSRYKLENQESISKSGHHIKWV